MANLNRSFEASTFEVVQQVQRRSWVGIEVFQLPQNTVTAVDRMRSFCQALASKVNTNRLCRLQVLDRYPETRVGRQHLSCLNDVAEFDNQRVDVGLRSLGMTRLQQIARSS